LNKLEGLVRSIDSPAGLKARNVDDARRVASRRVTLHWLLTCSFVRSFVRSFLHSSGENVLFEWTNRMDPVLKARNVLWKPLSVISLGKPVSRRLAERCDAVVFSLGFRWCQSSRARGGKKKRFGSRTSEWSASSQISGGAAGRVDNARRFVPVRCCQCNRPLVHSFDRAVFNAGKGIYTGRSPGRKIFRCSLPAEMMKLYISA